MYSFYRAWLMHDAFQSSIGNPPDVLLQVGPTGTQFAAHRAVLVAHSGYFKSVLTHPTNPVIVSNVGVPEFTALLTWMYTGFLDLNLENIYNILLATHLLHMPNALEVCRNFLVQNNHLLHESSRPTATVPAPYSQHNIIKPIPSRKFLPDTFRFEPILPLTLPAAATNPQPGQLLKPNENTSFHKITEDERKIVADDKDEDDDDDDDDSPEKIIDIVQVTSPKPSTSFRRSPSPARSNNSRSSLSPNLSEQNDMVVTQFKSTTTTKRRNVTATHHKKNKNHLQITTTTSNNENNKHQNKTPTSSSANNDNKVIIDIACCDGPVRFHRVLNNCYGIVDEDDTDQTPQIVESEIKNRTDIMNKIMSANIHNNKKMYKNEENSSSNDTPVSTKTSDNEIVFTCVYCNHTFKSQYCYQKHARRHINPVTLNSTCKITSSSAGVIQNTKISSNNGAGINSTTPVVNSTSNNNQNNNTSNNGSVATSNRREVKLLDMNVQYYPCKTCGSKFPSYYFVHKHRKMYHADEMVGEKDICGSDSPGNSQITTTTTTASSNTVTTSPNGGYDDASHKNIVTISATPPPNQENDN